MHMDKGNLWAARADRKSSENVDDGSSARHRGPAGRRDGRGRSTSRAGRRIRHQRRVRLHDRIGGRLRLAPRPCRGPGQPVTIRYFGGEHTRRASWRSRPSTRRCIDSAARDMTSDESRIKANTASLDLTGIDTVIFDKDGTLIDFHAMSAAGRVSSADRLDDMIRRPVSLDVCATNRLRSDHGRVAPEGCSPPGRWRDRRDVARSAPLVPERRGSWRTTAAASLVPDPAGSPSRSATCRRSSAASAPTDGASR